MIETIIFLLFASLMVTAGVGDFLTMKIPNWLNAVIGISFFAAAMIAGMPLDQIGWHLATGILVLVLGFGLFAAGFIGGGDAKLLAVTGLWLGSGQLIEFLIVMTLAGGALAVIMKFWWWIRLTVELHGRDKAESKIKASIDLPYGIAIAVGAIFAFQHSWWLENASTPLIG